MVTGVVGAKKREPLKTGFKKARKKLDGEFEMISVRLWHNETLNEKSVYLGSGNCPYLSLLIVFRSK